MFMNKVQTYTGALCLEILKFTYLIHSKAHKIAQKIKVFDWINKITKAVVMVQWSVR